MYKESLRKAYGESLVKLGKEDNRVVALEADLGKSTMSIMFGNEFPERYFQMGIAEQDMGVHSQYLRRAALMTRLGHPLQFQIFPSLSAAPPQDFLISETERPIRVLMT